jgi:hypothetical protein
MKKSKVNCKYCTYFLLRCNNGKYTYYHCKKEDIDLVHPKFICNKFKKKRKNKQGGTK